MPDLPPQVPEDRMTAITATVDPDDWSNIEAPLAAIRSRWQVADALTSALTGNADTIRAKLLKLAPDQLAAVIHRGDMIAVIGDAIRQERAAAATPAANRRQARGTT